MVFIKKTNEAENALYDPNLSVDKDEIDEVAPVVVNGRKRRGYKPNQELSYLRISMYHEDAQKIRDLATINNIKVEELVKRAIEGSYKDQLARLNSIREDLSV
jgi:hypothetical protein